MNFRQAKTIRTLFAVDRDEVISKGEQLCKRARLFELFCLLLDFTIPKIIDHIHFAIDQKLEISVK